VILRTKDWVFARRSAYWQREIASFEALTALWAARSADDGVAAIGRATVSFNFFYATREDIGWHYAGLSPVRATGWDPRFPVPAGPEAAWRGTRDPAEMPHVRNPKSGLIANWNNKPTVWWSQGDTPTWSRVFRNRSLLESIPPGRLSTDDLLAAAWRIARRETTGGWNHTAPLFLPHLRRYNPGQTNFEQTLASFDGWALDGSAPAAAYFATLDALRDVLFREAVGSFINPEFFRTAIQPALILAALEGRTAFDYRAGRTPEQIVRAAFERASTGTLGPYRAGRIDFTGQPSVVYNNRGTYIQAIELGPRLRGVNVLPPGVAEGATDQINLARNWVFKPMTPLARQPAPGR
jgi:penicillin amidase